MSDGTCGATTRLPSYGLRVCTQPAGHPAPCLMDRDLAVAWWGTKTTHRWAEPEQTGQLTLLREAA